MFCFGIQCHSFGGFIAVLTLLLNDDCCSAASKSMAASPVGLYTAYTIGKLKKEFVLTTRNKQLILEAQSCKERTLLLGDGTTKPRLLVFLAGANSTNNTSYIQRVGISQAAVENSSAPVLGCHERVALWVSWGDTYVSLGRGRQPGRGVVLHYTGRLGRMTTVKLIDPTDAADFSVGEWQFTAQQVRQLAVSTYDDKFHQFDLGLHGRFYVKFKVKVTGLGAAYVALSQTHRKLPGQTYVVVIGGGNNTWSSVRKRQGDTVTYINDKKAGVAVLNATEYRPFWISWRDGTISAGKGNIVGRQELVSWTDPEPSNITVVSLASSDNFRGYWVLETPVVLAPEYCSVSQTQQTGTILDVELTQIKNTDKFQTLITDESGGPHKYLPFNRSRSSKQLTVNELTPGTRYTFSTWGVIGITEGDACTCKAQTKLGMISNLKLSKCNGTFVSVTFTEAPGKKDGYQITCSPHGTENITHIKIRNCSTPEDCYCTQLQANVTYTVSITTVREGFESQTSHETVVANLTYHTHKTPHGDRGVPLGTVIGGLFGAILFLALVCLIVVVSKRRTNGSFRSPFRRKSLLLSDSGSRAELVYNDGNDATLGNPGS